MRNLWLPLSLLVLALAVVVQVFPLAHAGDAPPPTVRKASCMSVGMGPGHRERAINKMLAEGYTQFQIDQTVLCAW